MNKRLASVALILISVALGVSLGASRTSSSSIQNRVNEFEQNMKRKTGEATKIQEGVMTKKQKKHSKLFKGFETTTRGKKVRELVAETGDVYLMATVGCPMVIPSYDLQQSLRNLTCGADAVVIGTVKSKDSQIIEEGTFVFTDYELHVVEVLKNDSASPVEPGGAITFTSTGGAVELNGHAVRALDRWRDPLQVGGDYLLYLERIPETGAYRGIDGNSRDSDTFQIKDGVITQASGKDWPLRTRTIAADAFMDEVRAVLNRACNK